MCLPNACNYLKIDTVMSQKAWISMNITVTTSIWQVEYWFSSLVAKFLKCMITFFSNKPYTLTFYSWDDGRHLAVFTCSCSPGVYRCAGWYINSCTSPFGRSEFLPKMTPPCAVSGGNTTNVSHETGFILTGSPATQHDKNKLAWKNRLRRSGHVRNENTQRTYFILQQIASCIFTNFKFIVTNVIVLKYQAYAVSNPPFLW